MERARDLFEQALKASPAGDATLFYLQYAALEEKHGLARHAMAIYERATNAVPDKDRTRMFVLYIQRAAERFGVARTREIYERAIADLPDAGSLAMSQRYAQMELRLGEIDRARAIYVHASQLADPRLYPLFWRNWHEFEVQYGNEDTFAEMSRIKRSVQTAHTTTVNVAAVNMASMDDAPVDLGPGAEDFMAELEKQAAKSRADQAADQPGDTPDAITLPPEAYDDDDDDDEDGEDANADDDDVVEKAIPAAIYDSVSSAVSSDAPTGAKARLLAKRKRAD